MFWHCYDMNFGVKLRNFEWNFDGNSEIQITTSKSRQNGSENNAHADL